MEWIFFGALTFLSLAGYARLKTGSTIGAQPVPGTTVHTLYSVFGAIASFAAIGLAIWGFFSYSWWVPPLAYVGAALAAGLIFARVPIGATHVLIGFPIGAALAVLVIVAEM